MLNDWGQRLPFLKSPPLDVRSRFLRNFELIDVCHHSQKTWYEANWFTVNLENVEALWNRICQNQQIDLGNLNISICSQQGALLAIKQAHNVHYISGNKLTTDEQSEAKNKVLVKEEERKEIFIHFTF